MNKWIVITGNPVDGCNYIGPFDSREAAEDYIYHDSSDWWVVELQSPDTEEEGV